MCGVPHGVWAVFERSVAGEDHGSEIGARRQLHLPLAQWLGARQGIPQPPQFVVLVVVSTHTLLQSVSLPVHEQLPPLQLADWQDTPQYPQFEGSLFRSTQLPAHSVSPDPHTQAPA
jgi:hypothetical protein